jgi:predicted DNA-binding protein with PD1-like motif
MRIASARYCSASALGGASLTAIGAFRKATLGFFDFAMKTYKKIPVDEQTEVLSAIGDIAIGDDGKPSLDMHVVLGFPDGSTKGGPSVASIRPLRSS